MSDTESAFVDEWTWDADAQRYHVVTKTLDGEVVAEREAFAGESPFKLSADALPTESPSDDVKRRLQESVDVIEHAGGAFVGLLDGDALKAIKGLEAERYRLRNSGEPVAWEVCYRRKFAGGRVWRLDHVADEPVDDAREILSRRALVYAAAPDPTETDDG